MAVDGDDAKGNLLHVRRRRVLSPLTPSQPSRRWMAVYTHDGKGAVPPTPPSTPRLASRVLPPHLRSPAVQRTDVDIELSIAALNGLALRTPPRSPPSKLRGVRWADPAPVVTGKRMRVDEESEDGAGDVFKAKRARATESWPMARSRAVRVF